MLSIITQCEECGQPLERPLTARQNFKFKDGSRLVYLCYSCYEYFVKKAGNVPEKKKGKL